MTVDVNRIKRVMANRAAVLATMQRLLAGKQSGDPGYQNLWDRVESYKAMDRHVLREMTRSPSG